MTWEPWVQYKEDLPILNISAPPCPGCKYWKPVRLYDSRGGFDGVRLCHAADMDADFSCFKERPA
jgi:hypothetical protein